MDQQLLFLVNRTWAHPALDRLMAVMSSLDFWWPFLIALGLVAAISVRDAGAEIERIVAVIDRQEGARQNIEGAGLVFESLFTTTDLGIA